MHTYTKPALYTFYDITSSTQSFVYLMFQRFEQDCLYYLGNGNRCAKHLWMKNPYTHLEVMELMGNFLNSKTPYSVSMEKIEELKEKMLPNNFSNLFDFFQWEDWNEDSFSCKASEQALSILETQSLAVSLLWENDLDFVLAGEDGCVSNYDMYTPIYTPKTDKIYFVLYSVAERWKEGDMVTIYGRTPTEEEREYIKGGM